ncbi:MAG: hypothetical protein IKF38_00495 [Clostridia bacterium]|nr:hypothetical protein [Clostridia bacterium]
MKKFFKVITKLIFIVVLVIGLYYIYNIYETNNFKEYKKSVEIKNVTEFKRDNEIKYSSQRSYKIESPIYNDAMISKQLKLTKNKSYRVTCMVKTENVESENQQSGSGAHLSLEGTTIRSISITGTTDWQKIELIFNSKNEENYTLGVRLGGFKGKCKGTAWFSDIKVEEGVPDTSNEWKFACFIYNTTDVNINNKNIKLNVTDSDVRDIKNTINRFQEACITLSERKMSAKCDIYSVSNPLSKLSYDNEFAYYVAPEDVEKDIKATINSNNYDHIFVVIRLGDDQYKDDIEVNDWIGLGGMDYYGIGFSNIRLPNDSKSYIYKYDTRINTFPEEVFLHEFLHSLERSSQEYGYTIPALHDYQKYGYKMEKLIGQKKWYTDYMNCNIDSNGTKIGLPSQIFNLKPAKQIDFKYSYEIRNAF